MNEKKNSIVINGHSLNFTQGETILQVAQRNNIKIPTLCYLKGTAPTGSCRMCVVEIEGARSLMTACTVPASSGMVVKTDSEKVIQSRRVTIQLLLASGNHNCAIRNSDNADWTDFQLNVHDYDGNDNLCPVWGDCRLQDLAYEYQVAGDRFPRAISSPPVEDVNPFIIRDFSRCILCGRCVQACNEVQVNLAINFGYRGAESKIIAAGDRPLKDSDCVFCGECIQVCPVGALVEKNSRYKVRDWETEKVKSTCAYCGVGCQIYLHAKDNKIVKVTGAEETGPNYGSLCVKGRFGFDFINSEKRLTNPLIKENGNFKEVSWDKALQYAADNLNKIKNENGSNSIGVLTSARITNEENYIAQKFSRAVLKTNNIDHCARL